MPGLLPAAGRLANAAVALLGPDYTFGSAAYLTCKSIINDMRALGEGGESSGRMVQLFVVPNREVRPASSTPFACSCYDGHARQADPHGPCLASRCLTKTLLHARLANAYADGSQRRTDDAVSAALETVLYAQMLVLFAPQAVPAKSHLPVLVRCESERTLSWQRGVEL